MERLGVQEGEVIEHPLVTRRDRPRAEAGRGAQLRHPQAPARVRRRDEPAAHRGLRPAQQGARRARTSSETVLDAIEERSRDRVAKVTGGESDARDEWNLKAPGRRAVVPAHAPGRRWRTLEDRPLRGARGARPCERGRGVSGARGRVRRSRAARSRAPLYLYTLDEHWRDHLYELDHLKGGIGLRAYGQRDPLLEYKKEAFGCSSTLLPR